MVGLSRRNLLVEKFLFEDEMIEAVLGMGSGVDLIVRCRKADCNDCLAPAHARGALRADNILASLYEGFDDVGIKKRE